ncbi:hypothetical protein JTB14_037779 [Gonioctena quinquepunctata]|nr:hypothetical protein JTB14_037779 [Gonioctena quinquepunctata]
MESHIIKAYPSLLHVKKGIFVNNSFPGYRKVQISVTEALFDVILNMNYSFTMKHPSTTQCLTYYPQTDILLYSLSSECKNPPRYLTATTKALNRYIFGTNVNVELLVGGKRNHNVGGRGTSSCLIGGASLIGATSGRSDTFYSALRRSVNSIPARGAEGFLDALLCRR